jgi:putative transposase
MESARCKTWKEMANAKSWCKSTFQDSSTGSRFARKTGKISFSPTFHSSSKISKLHNVPSSKRKLKAKTARTLATWCHYRFRQRLLQKSREYPWCRVIIVNEANTSKICGMCGQINSKLGGRKTFHCSHCKMRCDRDVNVARNILLRFLSK